MTAYSIGDPTDEEQLYLEFINRARAHPAAEAERLRRSTDPEVLNACAYFGVDFDRMVQQMSALAATPPLSLNPQLTAAARLHSLDMWTNGFQSHNGSDGSSPVTRVQAQGYAWAALGENVYSWATSVAQGHAGFEIDWGPGVGGMQTPPGHRDNIHGGAYREIGIGVVNGRNAGVGPQLVTQEFSRQFGLTPFITGVAYYDLNANGFYDLGEGLPGVTVSVVGSSFFAVTTNSGGYSVPVPGDGSYTVSFSAPGFASTQAVAVVTGGNNVKVDFTPRYAPPVITGSSLAAMGVANQYTFTPVGGAVGYQWKQTKRVAATILEGAEKGLGKVIATTTPGYSVLDAGVQATGSNSFHLCHPLPVEQSFALDRVLKPSAGSQFIFASRLGYATANQIARAQISTNSGATWLNVWSQPGDLTSGQPTFRRTTNALAAYAGQEVMLRFSYEHTGGSYFNQTTAGMGFYVDDILVTGAEELIAVATNDTATTAFAFTPTETTDGTLRVRADLGQRFLDWGPALPVSVTGNVLARVRITGPPTFSGDRVLLNVTVISGTATRFQVETARDAGGPWLVDESATVETILPGVRLRANAAAGRDGRCFYRVVPQ